jgi:rubredoxin
MSSQQQASFDRHLELVRERMDEAPSFTDQLQQIVSVQSTLGKLGAKEDPAITSKRLELEDKKLEREHVARTQAASDERSGKMWNGIAGTISKVLEAPIVREVGRKAAESMPGMNKVAGGVANVQHAAARSALDQSSDIPFGFKCPTCNVEYSFNQQQLAAIGSLPNHTWVCPACGSAYVLSAMPGQQSSAGQRPAPQPPEQYRGPGF